MAKKTYWEKLKDPRWQKKRLEVLERAGWACEGCYDTESTLHVHHKVYFKGREPWEYELQQLVALCEACHESQHEDDPLTDAISRLPIEGPGNRSIMAAFLFGAQSIPKKFYNYHDCAAYLIGKRFENEFYELLKHVQSPESDECRSLDALLEQEEE